MKRKLDVSPNVSPGQASKALSDSPSAASASRQGDKRRKCVEKARQKKRTVLSDSESDRGAKLLGFIFRETCPNAQTESVC